MDINDLEIAEQERVYKGIATKPDMQVYFNGKRLTRGTDYHVGHYKNNQNVGTASCLVKGDGNFSKNIYRISDQTKGDDQRYRNQPCGNSDTE